MNRIVYCSKSYQLITIGHLVLVILLYAIFDKIFILSLTTSIVFFIVMIGVYLLVSHTWIYLIFEGERFMLRHKVFPFYHKRDFFYNDVEEIVFASGLYGIIHITVYPRGVRDSFYGTKIGLVPPKELGKIVKIFKENGIRVSYMDLHQSLQRRIIEDESSL